MSRWRFIWCFDDAERPCPIEASSSSLAWVSLKDSPVLRATLISHLPSLFQNPFSMKMSLMDSPAATQVGRKRVSLSFGFGAVMDFSDGVPGGMSQPRACGTCARAKAKCVASPGSNEKCERYLCSPALRCPHILIEFRCQRLKKVCEPAINRSREKRPQDST